MASRFHEAAEGSSASIPPAVNPGKLSSDEIDELLELRLIACLATVGRSDRIHLTGMWFRREGDAILMPTSSFTRKARNLRSNPHATVMIDQSRAGLDLRGILVRGSVDLIDGEEALELNRSIHGRYVTPDGLKLPEVVAYLTSGDDLTICVRMEEVRSWNLAAGAAASVLRSTGEVYALDT